MNYKRILFLFLFVVVGGWASAQESPVTFKKAHFDPLKERAALPGQTLGQKLESCLYWTVPQEKRRFPNMYRIFPSTAIAVGHHVDPLGKGKSIQPAQLHGFSISSYMKENEVQGLIVVKDGKIRLETYGAGFGRNTLWTSFSVAKSVSSMLLGIALKDGYIRSMDDSLAKYIPELKGEDYGRVTVRQLLTMTSGIDWDEDYADPNSDVARMNLGVCEGTESHILTYMKHMKSIHTPGVVWNYSTGETGLLGILIQKATGKNLSQYLSEKIWQPWGMGHEAHWLTDECSGLNTGGHGLSVSLRDYARIGMVMLAGGKKGKIDLFAKEWLRDATTPLYHTDKNGGGYGYLWWCFPNGSYAAFGIFGQMIYVNPKENLVIAQYAAWPKATSKELTETRTEFIKAIEKNLD